MNTPTAIKMHPCLRVPELLGVVFQMVKEEPGGQATVAALARTARCFQEVALDVLWEMQSSLVPLVKCFPSGLLTQTQEEDGMQTISFINDPQPEDWTRVKHYASRIRTLGPGPHVCHNHGSVLSLAGSVHVTLKRCIGAESLLPNLRAFSWIQILKSDEENVASLLLLLTPKVSSLTIGSMNWGEEAGQQVASAIHAFGENPAQLRAVNINCAPCPPIEEAILALGLRQKHLQEFHFAWDNEMPPAMVSHLSELNNLQSVAIHASREISQDILRRAKDRGGHFFPSLRSFWLTTDSLDVCHSWLNTIRHIRLSSIIFVVTEVPTAMQLHDFFVRLTEHPAAANLRIVRFSCLHPCPRNHPSHIVLPNTLAPLLKLSLSVLKLEPGMPVELDNDCIERMARAWPRLRMLEFGAMWRRYPAPGLHPRVTLMGLIPLAMNCPDLTTLALPFSTDVSTFEEDYEAGYRPAGGASFKRCFVVGVGATPLEPEADLLMVAGFLSDLFPDLVVVQTAWGRSTSPNEGDGWDAENQEMGKAWKKVEKYAREMARVRRQERMWLEI